MEVNILLFGIAKDIVGSNKLKLLISEGGAVQELKNRLTEEYPGLLDLKSIAFAVNEEYVQDDYVLNVNDEIVIIPPVSGG